MLFFNKWNTLSNHRSHSLLESLAYFNLTSSNFVIDRADQYNCTYSIDSTIVSWRWSKLPYFLSSLTIIYIGLIQKKTFPLETLKWKKIIKQFIFYLIFDSWNKEHLRQEKNIIKIFNLKRIDQNLSEWRNFNILGLFFTSRELIKC